MFQKKKKTILKVQKEQHHLEPLQHHLTTLWPVHQQSEQALEPSRDHCDFKTMSPEMFTSFLDLRVD